MPVSPSKWNFSALSLLLVTFLVGRPYREAGRSLYNPRLINGGQLPFSGIMLAVWHGTCMTPVCPREIG